MFLTWENLALNLDTYLCVCLKVLVSGSYGQHCNAAESLSKLYWSYGEGMGRVWGGGGGEKDEMANPMVKIRGMCCAGTNMAH